MHDSLTLWDSGGSRKWLQGGRGNRGSRKSRGPRREPQEYPRDGVRKVRPAPALADREGFDGVPTESMPDIASLDVATG